MYNFSPHSRQTVLFAFDITCCSDLGFPAPFDTLCPQWKHTVQCNVEMGTALHCTALHCTALNCTALHCTALHCTALHCTALHCTVVQCSALHCTVLYCTALRGHRWPPQLPTGASRRYNALQAPPRCATWRLHSALYGASTLWSKQYATQCLHSALHCASSRTVARCCVV